MDIGNKNNDKRQDDRNYYINVIFNSVIAALCCMILNWLFFIAAKFKTIVYSLLMFSIYASLCIEYHCQLLYNDIVALVCHECYKLFFIVTKIIQCIVCKINLCVIYILIVTSKIFINLLLVGKIFKVMILSIKKRVSKIGPGKDNDNQIQDYVARYHKYDNGQEEYKLFEYVHYESALENIESTYDVIEQEEFEPESDISSKLSFEGDRSSEIGILLCEEISTTSKCTDEIRTVIKQLYPCNVCQEIILKQLEKKTLLHFKGNWERLKIEFLIPASTTLMQLRKNVQGSRRKKETGYTYQQQCYNSGQPSPPQPVPTHNMQQQLPPYWLPEGHPQRRIQIPQRSFQVGHQQSPPVYQKSWPLCTKNKVVVHLNEPESKNVKEGSSYFYVAQSGYGSVNMVLRHMKAGNIEEYPISPDEKSHTNVFTENGDDSKDTTEDELIGLLSQCLVAAEQGVESMAWDQLKLSARYPGHSYTGNGCNSCTQTGTLPRPGNKRHTSQEAKVLHRKCSDGSLVKEEPTIGLPVVEQIPLPVHISDIEFEVLKSGAAVLTGCKDKRGGAVILVFCKHSAWDQQTFSSTELAKLLLYYQSLPSEAIQGLGMTVIVDMRGTTLNTLNVLLETLYTVESSQPKSIHIVHVLADKVAQSLLFKSSVFRPQVNLKIDLVTSIDTVYKFVDRKLLPPELGGCHQHNHQEWINFRMHLDPFLEKCRNAAKFLVHIMQEISMTSGMPSSSQEAEDVLEQHEMHVKKALDEPVLVELQTHGEDNLTAIKADMLAKEFKEDYRDSYDSAKQLFRHVKDSMFKLVKLADNKFHRLEQCLQLRQFEEKVAMLMNWLCTDGEDILRQHTTLGDNLKSIKSQQTQFEKSYFEAMTHLEKGNDLIEEASMLSQSDELEQVTGIKEVSKELKNQMKGFTGRLEEVRENIENTGHCYTMLDQCYEWALEAMKYVSSMKMERDLDSCDVDKLLKSLDLYLREHPPISPSVFEEMESIAIKLDNEKLQEQCKVAHQRCMETEQLLHVRKSTLKKAKEQMELEAQYEQERRDSLTNLCSSNHSSQKLRSPSSHNFGPVVYRDHRSCVNTSSSLWQQQTCSSPVGPSLDYVLRRRSYAGKPSAPVYSPSVAAFKENIQGMNLFEYEEHLFNEGLITEDMSDRIVTSLPKGLSDSTLRSSRESLRGSQENVTENSNMQESGIKDNSRQTGANDSGNSKSKSLASRTSSLMITLNKHNKPHKKIMRRAASCMIPEPSPALHSSPLHDTSYDIKDKRASRTLSMITTQSTDSLPSLPEEDSLDKSAQAERRQGWSPTPTSVEILQQRAKNPLIHQSMTDLRLAEEDIKRRRQLQLIMSEMVQTENDYVEALRLIKDEYIPEINRDDVPQALRGKRNIIFGNIEKIYEFHSQYFLSELRSCMDNPYLICHCFLNHEAEFFLYALYNKNKPKSDTLMMEYGRRFFSTKQVELNDKMDLSSYLLKPVQRMGKYSLLLKQIIKECPPSEPEYPDLKAAYEMVKFQLRHGNDLLAMDCLTGADVNLQEQGMLLRQDTFMVYHGRRKAIRHVFLFEEMIVFSKTKRTSLGKDIYVYKNSIKSSDLGLTESTGDSCFKFEIWFRKRTAQETYILQAPSMDIKNEWIRDISRLLWKQAIKNREMRKAESVRMGAGSKPCIDLKPSSDNIQDRFVNISLANRVPRIRNSIAVSNLDHLQNNNKRPHSLISVSSTSSSSSSGAYGGGALSITFESPYESAYENTSVNMKPLPRSATMCSNESGIVADIGSPVSPVKEDAFTQTTLKRPIKKSSDSSSRDSLRGSHLELSPEDLMNATTDV